ncbi:hypothetical protein GCM10009687_22390 [Asanoa iriomotensis]|uniref:Uncharacterized protein n=1 Tax=Asanoa iriomotensis TaxID=234613 RepID=A0ABQ4CFP4_9ACTN|nr:hypothetical protein Air01nite_76860 [Asanoa iriomotensis]
MGVEPAQGAGAEDETDEDGGGENDDRGEEYDVEGGHATASVRSAGQDLRSFRSLTPRRPYRGIPGVARS